MTSINRWAVELAFAAWPFAVIAVTAGTTAVVFKDHDAAELFAVVAGTALVLALRRARRWPA
ncbi:hypothetical protein [Actinoplanes sp. NPDC020271]|uniref:hypothetical protein n=1 Tax=Actinoplanes sp. NPDC020271 TaxID=3363896 RepID=UPI003791C8AF